MYIQNIVDITINNIMLIMQTTLHKLDKLF
jgi:hypothetical protein